MGVSILADWLVSFGRVWFSFSANRFVVEAEKAKYKLQSTYFWIALTSMLYLSILVLTSDQRFDPFLWSIPLFFSTIFMPFVFFAHSFIIFLICKKVFGSASIDDDELRYTLISIFVPFFLINLAFSLLSEFGIYVFGISTLYLIYLLVTGIKVIANISYWQSATAILLGSTIGSCFACIYTLVALNAPVLIP